MTSSLPISKIQIDGGTQSRAGLNTAVVDDYAQVIRDGTDFPPVTVFHDGKKYWLADGFHRVAAYKKAGATDIAVAVHQGTRRDAILFSVGANAAHGLRRTNDDKHRAVMTLLGDKEWSGWSNREIARRAGVGEKFVRSLRPERSEDDAAERTYITKHGTPATMATANIGKAAAASPTGRNILPEVLELIRGTKLDNDSYLDKLNGMPGNEQFKAAKRDVAFEKKRDRESEKAEGERQRQEARDALPADIKAAQAHRSAPSRDFVMAGLQAELDEVKEAYKALAEEHSALQAAFAKLDGMRVQYEIGGFAKVIEDKDREIHDLATRVATESRDKVAYLRKLEFWKGEAKRLGYDDEDVIPLDRANG